MYAILDSLSRIDARLDPATHHYLSPPLPVTRKQKDQWNPYFMKQQPPILPKWNPPAHLAPACDGGAGFMLNDRTACFQRGFCPQSVYDDQMKLFADGFNHTLQGITEGLRDLAYDFFIVIRARTEDGREEVAAACMVELRCAEAADTIPYLFVYELVTSSTYGRHGLAQQLIHATDTLAFLMTRSSQNDGPGSMWHATLNGRRLFIVLTVDRTAKTEYWHSLVKLYSRCGMYARRPDTPQFKYSSFTPYMDQCLDPDSDPTHYITMYKEAAPCSVYSDGAVSLMVVEPPATAASPQLHYYYAPIPAERIDTIRRSGLTPNAHACLHRGAGDEVYIAPRCLTFTRQRPAAGCVFVLAAVCGAEQFEMRSSVPSWFAVFIGEAGAMDALLI